ncbi:hypothetical protein [Bradyrhizobium acaciae]|uniref:hypothetical protein n=1 Tax=Bradyrhizobium acaciae TaxID=2683706 RepID=UPI001E284B3A|nr:hypothetical protein [Bradyrhizobium acaciae]MCC8977586.1 hypothetical protein [Bradyrhizobium acaciae]
MKTVIMREFLSENIFDYFNNGQMSVTKSELIQTPTTRISLRRNDDLDLIFEFTSRMPIIDRPEQYPAGTVRSADETIEFRHSAGPIASARGVIDRGIRSCRAADGQTETVQTYSAHSIELDLQRPVQPAYVVEWILNIPDGYIWPEPVRFKSIETSTKSVGAGEAEIQMNASSETGGGGLALHLRISGVDLYVMPSIDKSERDKKPGQIVYRGCPSQEFRDKVRTCVSFVLGKPIVYLGHTEYCHDWQPTSMRSVDALSFGGAAFKLPDLPPYPISDPRYENVLDPKRVADMVEILLKNFDAIKFNEVSWTYWHAVLAPIHAAAGQFGSLIEQLQNNYNKATGATRGKLLPEETWNALNSTIQCWLKTTQLELDVRTILEGKVSSLNQAPQNLILERLLDTLGLAIGEVETKSWKHRNMSAHGGISDSPIDAILNSKILKILFHRMLAGITKCSDRYIDYYNLRLPIRRLPESVPRR